MALSLGVCCMSAKATSKPVRALLDRISRDGDIAIVSFPEDTILEKPVEEWSRVDCLLAFESTGFPLEKCEAYVKLTRPVVVNNISAQHILRDRVQAYRTLQLWAIPCPDHFVVDHLASANGRHFVEQEDSIEYLGRVLPKPFVEKPMDADRHDIYIYYPSKIGGGAKRLFRKVKDQSSDYCAQTSRIRRDGTYIYEPFLDTDGLDYKCYSVGPAYVHAESRKAPTGDGKVDRCGGNEVRDVVALTAAEKEISSKVVKAFDQFVCGFDILRTRDGRSIVCDVNGWSMVKGDTTYYDQCASLIRAKLLSSTRSPTRSLIGWVLSRPSSSRMLRASIVAMAALSVLGLVVRQSRRRLLPAAVASFLYMLRGCQRPHPLARFSSESGRTLTMH